MIPKEEKPNKQNRPIGVAISMLAFRLREPKFDYISGITPISYLQCIFIFYYANENYQGSFWYVHWKAVSNNVSSYTEGQKNLFQPSGIFS